MENVYIFVKGRIIRYIKSVVKDDISYKTIYLSFYNNKPIISDTKLGLKEKLIIDIEKKKEKDEYYKRY